MQSRQTMLVLEYAKVYYEVRKKTNPDYTPEDAVINSIEHLEKAWHLEINLEENEWNYIIKTVGRSV